MGQFTFLYKTTTEVYCRATNMPLVTATPSLCVSSLQQICLAQTLDNMWHRAETTNLPTHCNRIKHWRYYDAYFEPDSNDTNFHARSLPSKFPSFYRSTTSPKALRAKRGSEPARRCWDAKSLCRTSSWVGCTCTAMSAFEAMEGLAMVWAAVSELGKTKYPPGGTLQNALFWQTAAVAQNPSQFRPKDSTCIGITV